MKFEKFMTEVTKAILREKKVLFWEYGDRVVITYDGIFAVVIPNKQNIFNREISTRCPISYDWRTNNLKCTTELKRFGKRTARIFETEKLEKVFVDEKYLDYFDEHAEFYGNSPKSPVYVEENGFLHGVIMPILNK